MRTHTDYPLISTVKNRLSIGQTPFIRKLGQANSISRSLDDSILA